MQKSIFTFIVMALTALALGPVGSGCSSHKIKKKSSEELKADLYYSHGTQKLVEKEYTEALDSLLKAYALQPENSPINNNLGMAYFFKNKSDKALYHFKQALKLDEKNSDARTNLASLYFRLEKLDLAAQQYHEALKDLVYKNPHRVHHGLALIALEKGHTLEARKRLKLALAERPNYCAAHFQLGLLAKKAYHYDEAYERFKFAVQGTCYGEVEPHYEQALALIHMRNFRKAHKKLEEIIERFPRSHISTMAKNKAKELKKLMNSSSKYTQKDEMIKSPSF